MEKVKRILVAAIFMVSICVGVTGMAFAEEHEYGDAHENEQDTETGQQSEEKYDDVYENEQDPDTDLQAEDITEDDLRSFVEAANEVQRVREDYANRISQADSGQYEDLRNEAVDSMVQAIEDAGLDEQKYRGIGYHVNEDQEMLEDLY